MIAFDTNVLVRVLVGDDPQQTKTAERSFLEHTKGDGAHVASIVLCELARVLGRGYGWSRESIHDRLLRLVRTRGVFVEEVELVDTALSSYREGGADLADYLVLGQVRKAGAHELLTFDRRLAREAGVRLL